MSRDRITRDKILADAIDVFCPIISGASASEKSRAKNESAKVRRWGNRFFDRMESERPFKNETEAVEAIAPIVIWGFGWAARQLAIMVITYLWNHWMKRDVVKVRVGHEADNSVGDIRGIAGDSPV